MMKTHATLALLMGVSISLTACTTSNTNAVAANRDAAHSSHNALDWAGVYRGVLPCADCPGIETVVELKQDGTYITQAKYLGKNYEVAPDQGQFSWADAGNTITLSGAEPARYAVGENQLTRLAIDGSSITGPNAEHYVLTKLTEAGVTERYWKLVELHGKPVPTLQREPFFILKAEGGTVTGFGGCNPLSGSYEINEATSRIRFENMASTMMACTEGMDIEAAFHQVLRTADNFSLNGDHLTLNRARMAPLARFVAVYLR